MENLEDLDELPKMPQEKPTWSWDFIEGMPHQVLTDGRILRLFNKQNAKTSILASNQDGQILLQLMTHQGWQNLLTKDYDGYIGRRSKTEMILACMRYAEYIFPGLNDTKSSRSKFTSKDHF